MKWHHLMGALPVNCNQTMTLTLANNAFGIKRQIEKEIERRFE
jgi:hypothetical protein